MPLPQFCIAVDLPVMPRSQHLLQERLLVQRRVAAHAAHALLAQRLQEAGPRQSRKTRRIVAEHVQVPRIPRAARIDHLRRNPRNLLQHLRQRRRVRFARARLPLQARHLRQQQRPLKLRQPQVRSIHHPARQRRRSHLPRPPVALERVCPVKQPFIVGDQRPAFARIQILRRLEAERPAVAQRPHLLPLPLAQMRLAGVLDQLQPTRLREFQRLVQTRRRSSKMHVNYRARLRRRPRFQFPHVHLERRPVRIHEYRQSVLQQNHVQRRHESVWRQQHLVARPHVNRVHRRDQRACPIRRRHAMLNLQQLPVLPLELHHPAPVNPPPLAAAQHPQQRVFLRPVINRPVFSDLLFSIPGPGAPRGHGHAGAGQQTAAAEGKASHGTLSYPLSAPQ